MLEKPSVATCHSHNVRHSKNTTNSLIFRHLPVTPFLLFSIPTHEVKSQQHPDYHSISYNDPRNTFPNTLVSKQMVKFGQYLKHNIVPEWRDKVGGWIRM